MTQHDVESNKGTISPRFRFTRWNNLETVSFALGERVMPRMQSLSAAVDGGPIKLRPTMWSILQDGILINPEHTALVVLHQKPDYFQDLVGRSKLSSSCLTWTYEQLGLGASRLAANLQAHGLVAGSTIATFITNSSEWALLMWAAAIGQYSIALLDPQSVEEARSDELQYFLKVLKPSLVVVEDGVGAGSVDKAAEGLSLSIKLRCCCISSSNISPSWRNLENLCRENHGRIAAPSTDDINRVATYMFTSGTSVGRPKGVPRTVESWLASAATNFLRPINKDTITSLTTQCFRMAANSLGIAIWHAGGTLIIPSAKFDVEKLLEGIEEYQINYIGHSHTNIFAYMAHPSFNSYRVKTVRKILIGSDVVTIQQLAQWRQCFPTTALINYLGMTEGTGMIGWPDGQIPEPLPVFNEIVSCGKAGPGTKLRIVDTKGDIVQRGHSGQLHIGGPVMVSGYLHGVQAENFYEDQDGRWMIPGDTAMIDADDNVFILGREKDIIKRKGIPIVPSSIESCLREYGRVNAQVIGIPHEHYGEETYAVIEELPKNKSLDDLKEIVVRLFGLDYALSQILTLEDLGMEHWPTSNADKILKRHIKEAVIRKISTEIIES